VPSQLPQISQDGTASAAVRSGGLAFSPPHRRYDEPPRRPRLGEGLAAVAAPPVNGHGTRVSAPLGLAAIPHDLDRRAGARTRKRVREPVREVSVGVRLATPHDDEEAVQRQLWRFPRAHRPRICQIGSASVMNSSTGHGSRPRAMSCRQPRRWPSGSHTGTCCRHPSPRGAAPSRWDGPTSSPVGQLRPGVNSRSRWGRATLRATPRLTRVYRTV
jgi:hypothetical protein